MSSSLQLQFTGHETDPEVERRIARVLREIPDRRLHRKWKRVEVRIHPPAETGMAVEHVHAVWNPDHVTSVKGPEGLPCLPGGTRCPPGSWLVEVSYISRLSGGMGSYHQFDGYFVSLVLTPDLAGVIDARMEAAY